MYPIITTLLLILLSAVIGVALFLTLHPTAASSLFYSFSEPFEDSNFPKIAACNCLPGFIQQKVNPSDSKSTYRCVQLKDMKTIRPCY